MAVISKPFKLFDGDGYCENCGKKLPKNLKHWCNSYCWNKALDKALDREFKWKPSPKS